MTTAKNLWVLIVGRALVVLAVLVFAIWYGGFDWAPGIWRRKK
jgi:hypothetical protein